MQHNDEQNTTSNDLDDKLESFSDEEHDGDDNYPYYWNQNNCTSEVETPLLEKAWHWTHFISAKTFEGMEFSGEVIATFLGLTRSKYQWVIDAQEHDVEEKRLRRLEDRQRKQMQLEAILEEEKAKLKAMEEATRDI